MKKDKKIKGIKDSDKLAEKIKAELQKEDPIENSELKEKTLAKLKELEKLGKKFISGGD